METQQQPTGEEEIHFTVAFKKEILQIQFSRKATIKNLKELLGNLTGVDPVLQKLLFKGIQNFEL